eukprot:5019326-Pyramimonas_sp.AAC.1
MIDEIGNVVAAASGPAPFPRHTSGAAELHAARHAALHKSQWRLHHITAFKELHIGWLAGYQHGAHS